MKRAPRVKDVMTRGPRCCRAEDTLSRAAQLMWDHDCGAVPVLGSEGGVIGMITDRDVCMAAYTQGRPLSELRVESAMSRTLSCCGVDDSIEDAAAVMRAAGVRRLPVLTKDCQLAGIVSLDDLAIAAANRGDERLIREVEATLAAVCRPHSAMA